MSDEKHGKWRGDERLGLPARVEYLMATPDPDWDWTLLTTRPRETWLVARLFDGNRETQRVACKVMATHGLDDLEAP